MPIKKKSPGGPQIELRARAKRIDQASIFDQCRGQTALGVNDEEIA